MDIENTYSGLTNGCAKGGRLGCKLIEFTGDNANGDDVKALLDYAHDVIGSLPEQGNRTDYFFHLSCLSSFIAMELQFRSPLASSRVRFLIFTPPEPDC